MLGGMLGGMMSGTKRRRRPAGGAILRDVIDADGPAAVGQSATTDENGRFTAPGLLVGARCRLVANHPDGGQSPEARFPVKTQANRSRRHRRPPSLTYRAKNTFVYRALLRQRARKFAPSPLGEKRRRHYTASSMKFERIDIPVQWRCNMPTLSKIGPRLALCGLIAGLFLVGWAARYSAAQNPAQDEPKPAKEVPRTTVKGEEPKAATAPAANATKSEVCPFVA